MRQGGGWGSVAAAMRLMLAGLVLLAGLGTALAGEPVVASRMALGEHPDKTRFVIDLSDQVEYRLFTLADPYRVVIDLPQLSWQLPADTGLTGKGLVKGFRYGLFRSDNSRVVLDLWKPARVITHYILPPDDRGRYRLIIDLAPAERETFLATAGWPEDAAPAAAPPPLMPLDRLADPGEKPVIVIDAGHGGLDPGATGPGGTHEKEIVLALALTLRDVLERTGRYQVVMTRDTDVFLELRQRVAIARAAKADLFLSLHADSINKPDVRGASIYTLSDKASDQEAAELARAENAADLIAGVDLTGEADEVVSILIDLAQRETMNYSVAFARTLVATLPAATALLPRPHREAPFRVLKAPDVPSVLVELGFLSNAEEEKIMLSEPWRARVVEALRQAVDRYFAERRERLGIPPALPRQAGRRDG